MANRVVGKNTISEERSLSDYSELRSLLLGPEQARLQQLRDQQLQLTEQINSELARLEEQSQLNSERLAKILPEAIDKSHQSGDSLSNAFVSTLEDSIKISVNKDSKKLANAIFPILGPAIRKSIIATLHEFVQSFNDIIEQSLSIKGLKWRFESIRTGQSFAEIALKHSLVYSVEQVFLIHRESGLLLAHEMSANAMARDPDLVSGMLSAIQSFVEDSFAVGDDSGLDALRVGELSLWIDQAPYTVMALVIRGNAPTQLRELLRETNKEIHTQNMASLQAFNGDISHFENSHGLLRKCIKLHFNKGMYPKKKKPPILSLLVIVLSIMLFFVWATISVIELRRWNQLIDHIASQSGIVVVDDRYGGAGYISGLRDPIADDPETMLVQAGFDFNKVSLQFESYHSLDDEMVLRRAAKVLTPPSSIKLSLNNDNDLLLRGLAHNEWLINSRQFVGELENVNGYDDSQVLNIELLQLHKIISEWRQVIFLYEKGVGQLNDSQQPQVVQLANNIKGLIAQAEQIEQKLVFHISGFADKESGTLRHNQELSQARAKYVYDMLMGMGVDAGSLKTSAEVTESLDTDSPSGRRVVVSPYLTTTD